MDTVRDFIRDRANAERRALVQWEANSRAERILAATLAPFLPGASFVLTSGAHRYTAASCRMADRKVRARLWSLGLGALGLVAGLVALVIVWGA